MSFRIYTKTGDTGETGLFGGARLRKDNLRVSTYGDVDELNAVLALALQAIHSSTGNAQLLSILKHMQGLMFELGAVLATAPGARSSSAGILDTDIEWLEQVIDELEKSLPQLKSFILPGGTLACCHLHLARTVCRRAERGCVSLLQQEASSATNTTATAVRFLNRLSDALFVCARYANHIEDVTDVPWQAR